MNSTSGKPRAEDAPPEPMPGSEEQPTTGAVDLQAQMQHLERENRELADQYVQIERQNNNLLSLYVASTRLHSTLDVDGVIRSIKEILIDLVGAEQFGVFVFDAKTEAYVLRADEGLEDNDPRRGPFPRRGDSMVARVAASGYPEVAEDPEQARVEGLPIAAVPLARGQEPVGLLAVYRLLSQKDHFEALDLELFDLLAEHASLALVASQLHQRTERKATTLQGLIDLIKEGPEADEGKE